MNNVDDSYSAQLFDGLGRPVATAGNHPNSVGHYKAQIMQYDLLGRANKQSNPTEINSGWVPAGDDNGADASEPVTWTNAVGVTVNGNNLTSTGNNWGTAGAVSAQTIAWNDGYVEFTASETNTHRMIGLSHGDSNQDYHDIDFA